MKEKQGGPIHTGLYWKPLKNGSLANIEDPDEMQHNALVAIINAIFKDRSTCLLGKSTCDPFKHVIDTPILIVAIWENPPDYKGTPEIKEKHSHTRQIHLQDLSPLHYFSYNKGKISHAP